MSTYKMTLSETDTKALVDEATAALDAGDEDKAIGIGRVLAADHAEAFAHPGTVYVRALFNRLYPIMTKHGLIRDELLNFARGIRTP